MYEILKQIAKDNNLGFTYARRDYANLHNEIPTGHPHVFLDPVQITETFGEYNQIESRQFAGSFLVVISSDIEKGNYEQRYLDEIKPILDETMGSITGSMKCGAKIQINSWRTVEVINLFDYGMDGIAVTYTVTEDV